MYLRVRAGDICVLVCFCTKYTATPSKSGKHSGRNFCRFLIRLNLGQDFLFRLSKQQAQGALMYYKSYKGKTEAEINAFNAEFERMKTIAHEQKIDEKLHFSDFSECHRIG